MSKFQAGAVKVVQCCRSQSLPVFWFFSPAIRLGFNRFDLLGLASVCANAVRIRGGQGTPELRPEYARFMKGMAKVLVPHTYLIT